MSEQRRFVLFMMKCTDSAMNQSFATFEEAWNFGKTVVEDHHKNFGQNMRMLHFCAQDCYDQPRTYSGNKLARTWVWADYGLGCSETKFACGEARIIEFVWTT